MTRNRMHFHRIAHFAALLAMSVLVLAQSAPIWAKKSDGTPLIICTALGTETIYIDDNGQEIPADSPIPAHTSKQHCVMCQAHHAKVILPSAQLLAPPPHAYTLRTRVHGHSFTRKTARTPNVHGIRAPPVAA